ncbi:heterokaryon incompatibility protein-domain-containing protein [Apodospora peruviana]|uniref:Heterokaryon incompatibility protein-domain-containing protein n=1 Tax=Apodospora peruviana TaxID=516989 RepID=A0AAE0IBH8_9PEZI|nr:heterokaryon incompatibility protein-domain-containing protein [Apodospora peruviana]
MSIRLINTTSLQMKTFVGRSTPPYAILSHTWVEDEEVSLLELQAIADDPNHPARHKSGYNKILKTCQIAVQHHCLGWAWVDTCCIDKSSSAELSEAINSMFKWYKKAAVCFAYLDDLLEGPVGTDRTALGNCRWFTRGWCLQELIAPSKIEFHNSRWQCVGTKRMLLSHIAAITKIDENALAHRKHLQNYAVGRKMSWAARRTTTRTEDAAYCLLGIFGATCRCSTGKAAELS